MGAYANPVLRGGVTGDKTPGSNQFGPAGAPSIFPGNMSMPGGGAPTPNPIASGSPYDAPNLWQIPGQTTPMSYPWGTLDPTGAGGSGKPGASHNLGHGIIATGLQYPGLSQDFANYLMSQVGAGMTPFNLSTPLPWGGQTQPGQLTAGLNPILQNMMQFYQGQGSNVPGLDQLQQIATQGVDATPEWKAMLAAQQQNIQQNQANLAEQFGSMGDLAGSPFGTAMSNYMSQTTADQNALLGQLQMTGLLQGQIPTAESLYSGATQFGSGLQDLGNLALQNQYQEFQRTQPQNNPMLQYIMGLSTLFPPTTKTPTGFDQFTSLLGALQGSGFSAGSKSIMF